jgi:serine/threonine protein kinase/tetratricopeptide (TPR) repeat protein
VDKICDRFEAAWLAGQRPCVKEYLGEVSEPERPDLFRELLKLDLHYRRQQRETPTEAEYCQLFPEYTDLIHVAFRGEATTKESRSAEAHSSLLLGEETGPESAGAAPVESPDHLGRYRITAKLGSGSFGIVYRAYDGDLQREVAIKVPHRKHVACPADIEAYLAEARVLASLEHPYIVPVHDFGRTDDGLCYVVSKFIAGTDLAKKIERARPSAAESAELVAAIAEALHHAHRQGVVHRDIKPANILLDTAEKPYVADFGLALREEDFGRRAGLIGSPVYMSPEQARGEGHRVDGRSDIFSLGVVFYELITGRRPFRGEAISELLEQIASVEARPPRQIDDRIPKELERICLKALAKRASERYTTARDFADDLRHFLRQTSDGEQMLGTAQGAALASPILGPMPTPPSDPQAIKIVPKGLRSFDERDADFFLELLPGPRDREGLPESIRFWKSRIDELDPERTFPVGLIYGPSGCGKSSLVKAGLLPRLARTVTAVYVEATAEETETRLGKGLRRRVAELPAGLGLVETLTALRRGPFLGAGQKVLLVLDQFEQWLHALRGEENTELVEALRQCDGGRLQCVVLVRDDFWMAVTRFMAALEIELLQGKNMAPVDLFNPRHAKNVLAAFGRAFGTLPERAGDLPKEEEAFLDQAVSSLAQEGKVISVRLALFAEMVKGKPWTPATLKEVGGMAGVGVTFLEETFAASTAPPQHRLHQKAAQAVLKALLPDMGTDIKGHMRSRQKLLKASGYALQPKNFDALLRILDGELRLISPTDPEGVDSENASSTTVVAGQKYYQLTHDYLVHSLRDWLTRKQKESRRGRAQLLLEDRAAVWNDRPEIRQLPSLLQWVQIRCLTKKKNWTRPQSLMMLTATGFHFVRGFAVVALLVVLVMACLEWGLMRGIRLLEPNHISPHTLSLQEKVAGIHSFGEQYAAIGQTDEAEECFRRALAMWEKVVSDNPTVKFRLGLGRFYKSLGRLYQSTNRLDKAEECFRKALPIEEEIVRSRVVDSSGDHLREAGLALAGTYRSLGEIAEKVRPQTALDWYSKATQNLEPFLHNSPGGLQEEFLHNTLVLARLGGHARAAQAADALVGGGSFPSETLYNSACVYALSSAAVSKDDKVAEPERRWKAEHYSARAVGLLRDAAAKGYKDVAHMKQDTDLEPLRDREDFKKLLHELEAQAPARN